MITIDRQLRRYFILVTVVSVLVIFTLSNIGILYFFHHYVEQVSLKSDRKIVMYLEDRYATDNGFVQVEWMRLVQYANSENAEIKLYDASGTLLFNSLTFGNGRNMMGRGQGMMMRDTPVISESKLTYREYRLQGEEKGIGKVAIGRRTSIIATTEDRGFILAINFVFLVALILSVWLARIISKNVAGKFLQPLMRVKRNLETIAENREDTVQVLSQTIEIDELAKATEGLARSLKNQEKLRKRLTSDIAHELRTPLATLQSHIEAMIDGVWEVTPQRLSNCYDEIIRITRLITDLNELSVVENEAIVLNVTPLDLSHLLEKASANFTSLFREKRIEFSTHIQPGIMLQGDVDRLNQIVVNILFNAYKYTDEQGSISVSLNIDGKEAVIEIRDTGCGIPAGDLPHIFERFYRGDVSRDRKTGGAGIGLTITKALIEAHHGRIEVASRAGNGTTVSIYLPLDYYEI
ncbi:ATP-binding protein [Dehalobacter sp. DCM]|uniref:sensor histidine kinase n=1 Tax=Dehalobacter sp. DCM TaxID=2907827 RepID=UPI0030812308|nr:ATP-binding protein [Dehalobacter sp. DCM]